MRLIVSLLLITLSQMAMAQIHVINADSLKLGETAGTNGIAFYGNPYFKNIGLGKLSDSVLVRQADGKIKFMPRSLLFGNGGGGAYTFGNGLTNAGGNVGLGGNAQVNYSNNFNIGGTLGQGTLELGENHANLVANGIDGFSYIANSNQHAPDDFEVEIRSHNSNLNAARIINLHSKSSEKMKIVDDITNAGFYYENDYSIGRTFPADNNWIPNAGWVRSQIANSGGGTGGSYIQASPSTPQAADIRVTGGISAGHVTLYDRNIIYDNYLNFVENSTGVQQFHLGGYGGNNGNSYFRNKLLIDNTSTGDISNIARSLLDVRGETTTDNLKIFNTPTLDSLPAQVLTRDATTGEVKYVPSSSFGVSGAAGSYIQANPSTPQVANINLNGKITNTVNIAGDDHALNFNNINNDGSAGINLGVGNNQAFIYLTGNNYFNDHNTYRLWNYSNETDAKMAFRVSHGPEIDHLTLKQSGEVLIGYQPKLDSLPTQILTRNSTTGEIKYVPSTLFGVGGTGGSYIEASPSSPQVANIRTLGFVDVYTPGKGRLIVGEDRTSLAYGEYPTGSSGNLQFSKEVNGEALVSLFSATSSDFPSGNGKQRGLLWHSNDNNGIIVNDQVSHRGLTATEIFANTASEDYLQRGNLTGAFIQANPSTPQVANIDVNGNIIASELIAGKITSLRGDGSTSSFFGNEWKVGSNGRFIRLEDSYITFGKDNVSGFRFDSDNGLITRLSDNKSVLFEGEANGAYIQANPSTPQSTHIYLNGTIRANQIDATGIIYSNTGIGSGNYHFSQDDSYFAKTVVNNSITVRWGEGMTGKFNPSLLTGNFIYNLPNANGTLALESPSGSYIQASPSTPQSESISINGELKIGVDDAVTTLKRGPGNTTQLLTGALDLKTNYSNVPIAQFGESYNTFYGAVIANNNISGNYNYFQSQDNNTGKTISIGTGMGLHYGFQVEGGGIGLSIKAPAITANREISWQDKSGTVALLSDVIGNSNAFSLDFPSVAQNQNADLTVTVTGAEVGDVVSLGLPNSLMAGLTWNAGFNAWVSATNTVTIRFQNHDASAAHDLPAGSFKVKVMK